MFKKRVYVIQDLESGLYVTRGQLQRRLDELGVNTQFFENQSDAMRVIEERPCDDCDDSVATVLQNDLAWDLLEKLYNQSRWHLDVSGAEYKDAISQFTNLCARGIDLYVD